ncbi:hypothetical protein Q7P37_011618 [Cladosporium fusiforme]
MAPIPVALCGKNPNMAASFANHSAMGPEYHVVHVFHTPLAVQTELPPLLLGKNIKPSSNLGSNATSNQAEAPKAIIVGAGFSRQELDVMRMLEGCETLPWLYPSPAKMAQTGLGAVFGKDFMTSIIERAKSAMVQNGLVEGREGESTTTTTTTTTNNSYKRRLPLERDAPPHDHHHSPQAHSRASPLTPDANNTTLKFNYKRNLSHPYPHPHHPPLHQHHRLRQPPPPPDTSPPDPEVSELVDLNAMLWACPHLTSSPAAVDGATTSANVNANANSVQSNDTPTNPASGSDEDAWVIINSDEPSGNSFSDSQRTHADSSVHAQRVVYQRMPSTPAARLPLEEELSSRLRDTLLANDAGSASAPSRSPTSAMESTSQTPPLLRRSLSRAHPAHLELPPQSHESPSGGVGLASTPSSHPAPNREQQDPTDGEESKVSLAPPTLTYEQQQVFNTMDESTDHFAPRTLHDLYAALRVPSTASAFAIIRALVIDLAVNHMFSTYSFLYPFDTNWVAGADRYEPFDLAVQFYSNFGQTVWNESAVTGRMYHEKITALEALFAGLRTRDFRRGGTRSSTGELLQQLVQIRLSFGIATVTSLADISTTNTGRGNDRTTKNTTNNTIATSNSHDNTDDETNEQMIQANEQMLQILFNDLQIFRGHTDDSTACFFQRFVAQFSFEVLGQWKCTTLHAFGPQARQPTQWGLERIANGLVQNEYAAFLWPALINNDQMMSQQLEILQQYLSVLFKLPLRREDLHTSADYLFTELLQNRPEMPEPNEVGDAFEDADEDVDEDALALDDAFEDENEAEDLGDAFRDLSDSEEEDRGFSEDEDKDNDNDNHRGHSSQPDDSPDYVCTILVGNGPCSQHFSTLGDLMRHLIISEGHGLDTEYAREYSNNIELGQRRLRRGY